MKKSRYWNFILTCIIIVLVLNFKIYAAQDRLQLRSPDNKVMFIFDSDKSDKVYSVVSPDKTIEVKVYIENGLHYTVLKDCKTIIDPSELSLILADGKETGIDVSIDSSLSSNSNSSWQTVIGPRKIITDSYNEIKLSVVENAFDFSYGLEFRVYNEGVAFRYTFPKTSSTYRVNIKEELTEFNFKKDHTCWPTFYGSYTTMQEKLYPESLLSDIMPGSIIGLPLTVKLEQNSYCSIAEASLIDYAGSYITNSEITELYSSPELVGGGSGASVSVKLPDDASQLFIKALSHDSINHDHVDLANARLFRADGSYAWLSDMTPRYANQDWGSLHFDESIDGNPITIGGQTYSRGLGSHANAAITYDIGSEFVRFEAVVGIDSEVGNNGKAQIALYATSASLNDFSFHTSLSRLNDQAEVVSMITPHSSPWRVIMLGSKPVDLLNSDIIVNLNEPCQISDTSWIKPGMASWNWMTTFHDLTMDAIKGFIDLSAYMNWEYALVDDGWYKNGNCTTSQDFMDIPELVDYAAQRNVKIWLWVHWESLNAHMEQAMTLYEDWGVVGIKVDFMSRDDQWMVNWYSKVLETAASHKLMVNFHGCYKPAGIRRTWPNLMTREAVYGLEQNFASYNDPVHKTIIPFTRMLTGPMDYTPGSFNNKTKSTWTSSNPVSTLGTRCQELALCLIYDSPVVNMAGSPEGYYGQPGLDFLKGLPTSWDNTIALDGKIGEYFISVRNKGDNWYIGGITNWDSRRLQVNCDFLESGISYQMTLYEDGSEAFSDNARDVNVRHLNVTSNSTLSFNLAPGGGFVAILKMAE